MNMTMAKRYIACMALFFILSAVPLHPVFSEEGKGNVRNEKDPVFSGYIERSTVRLVELRAIVYDKKGRIVTDLAKDDFKLFEDYFQQKISHFSIDSDEPISIAFLLDVSGSMRLLDRLDDAKQAIKYFVNTLKQSDRFALLIFADNQAEIIQEFTADKEKFLSVLDPIEAYGQTALNDAVAISPELVDRQSKGRKAIILLSDGLDNFSKSSPEQAVVLAKSVDVPIYVISFADLPKKIVGKEEAIPVKYEALQRYSKETGGLFFRVEDPDELKEACNQIEYELRHQYVIAYSPKKVIWDGQYRKLKLEVAREGLIVRTRKGYIAYTE